MVNVYDFDKTNIAELGRNKGMINSCMSINPKLMPGDVRRNLDLAVGIMKGYAEKLKKKVVKKEIPRNDGAFCTECGSMDLSPSGNCTVCRTCGKSQGCS